MKGYDVVSDFARQNRIKEKELAGWYFCDVLNSAASESLNGEYDLASKICVMGECLNGGSLEEFFTKEEVVAEGVSLEGFVEFVGKIKKDIDEGVETEVSWYEG